MIYIYIYGRRVVTLVKYNTDVHIFHKYNEWRIVITLVKYNKFEWFTYVSERSYILLML